MVRGKYYSTDLKEKIVVAVKENSFKELLQWFLIWHDSLSASGSKQMISQETYWFAKVRKAKEDKYSWWLAIIRISKGDPLPTNSTTTWRFCQMKSMFKLWKDVFSVVVFLEDAPTENLSYPRRIKRPECNLHVLT